MRTAVRAEFGWVNNEDTRCGDWKRSNDSGRFKVGFWRRPIISHCYLMIIIWNVVIKIWQGVGERVVVTGFVVNDAIVVTALIGTVIAFFV